MNHPRVGAETENKMSEDMLIGIGLMEEAYTSINARKRVAQIVGDVLGLRSLSIATIGDGANLEFQVMLGDDDIERFGDFWTGFQDNPMAIGSNLIEVLACFTSEFRDYCQAMEILNTSEF